MKISEAVAKDLNSITLCTCVDCMSRNTEGSLTLAQWLGKELAKYYIDDNDIEDTVTQ
jgi:hypothetical protein